MKLKIGQGFDVHEFSDTEKDNNNLLLAGIKIPFTRTLKGHSDADVVLHALVDSILGALAMGDIGDHFPPSDNKWKGANSKIFVDFAKKKLEEKNATINNIDITILAQEPKLFDFKELMKKNIAQILDIKENQVNVKASTTEKLGFIGRKEGILAAVISLITIPFEDNE